MLYGSISKKNVHPSLYPSLYSQWNPPRAPGLDDVTGEPLVRRSDDEPDVVQRRLEVYSATTDPILEYFRDRLWDCSGDAHRDLVAADRRSDAVFEEICAKMVEHYRGGVPHEKMLCWREGCGESRKEEVSVGRRGLAELVEVEDLPLGAAGRSSSREEVGGGGMEGAEKQRVVQ